MVSDILEESSDIVRLFFTELRIITDEFFGSDFFMWFVFFLVGFVAFKLCRFVFGDVSLFDFGSSEECAVCEFVKNGHCPYSLKEYNAEWCKEYCQINYQEDDLWK